MFTQAAEADKPRQLRKRKQDRWRSGQLPAVAAPSIFPCPNLPAQAPLRSCSPAPKVSKTVLGVPPQQVHWPTSPGPTPSTCLPPCSPHLPPPAGPPRFVFTALGRFSHIPGWGSHGRTLHSQSGGLPGSSTRSSTQPPATSTRAPAPPPPPRATPAQSWPPAASPRPCPFLGVIQPRPQPHGGAKTRPGVEDANQLTTD